MRLDNEVPLGKKLSIREIMQLNAKQLSSKIFTFYKQLASKDITKFNKPEFECLKEVVKEIDCMKDIEYDFIPSFKFFTFRKTKI